MGSGDLPGLQSRRFVPSRVEWWIRLPHASANLLMLKWLLISELQFTGLAQINFPAHGQQDPQPRERHKGAPAKDVFSFICALPAVAPGLFDSVSVRPAGLSRRRIAAWRLNWAPVWRRE
jgi:hypothetical protein